MATRTHQSRCWNSFARHFGPLPSSCAYPRFFPLFTTLVGMAYGPRKPNNRVRVAARIPQAVCAVDVFPQASAFCALPAEMKLDILERLGDIERTYLAVTCKKMAQDVNFYTEMKIAKSRQQQLSTPRTPPIKQKLRFVWHMQNERWVKNGRYKLCVDCTRFKLKSGNWGGDSKLLKTKTLPRDIQIKGPHCPRCVERNQTADFSRQQAMSRMMKRANAA